MIATINIISLILNIAIGVGMVMAGRGYWALVAMATSSPAIYMPGGWLPDGFLGSPSGDRESVPCLNTAARLR
jgi:hypothetical protein